MAREDGLEGAKIGRTCPRSHYTMADPGYSRRIDACTRIALALALEVERHLGVIRLLDGQAGFVNECLVALEPAGFNSAIDGHWLALDPDGTLDRSKLPQPDLKALAAAGAAQPYQITAQMREFWTAARERELATLADLLEGFDRFTLSAWRMSGEEARQAYGELFEDLLPLQPELAPVIPDEAEAKSTEEQFGGLWSALTCA